MFGLHRRVVAGSFFIFSGRVQGRHDPCTSDRTAPNDNDQGGLQMIRTKRQAEHLFPLRIAAVVLGVEPRMLKWKVHFGEITISGRAQDGEYLFSSTDIDKAGKSLFRRSSTSQRRKPRRSDIENKYRRATAIIARNRNFTRDLVNARLSTLLGLLRHYRASQKGIHSDI